LMDRTPRGMKPGLPRKPGPLRLAKLITNEKPSLVAFHTRMSTGVMTRLNTVRLRKGWSEGPITSPRGDG
jgi:hypothetical protein